MFSINKICKIGGDDGAVGGGIRNEEPVVISGSWYVKLPAHIRIFTTYANGWQVIFIILRRCLRGCRPGLLILFIFDISPCRRDVKGLVIDKVAGWLLFDLGLVRQVLSNFPISTHSII
jgi:hypothetical protein